MSDRAITLDGSWNPLGASLGWKIGRLRRLCSRWDMLGFGALASAWLVLVVWTAGGSESWQARVCADLMHRPRSCEATEMKKDESRIAPAAAASQAAS